MTRKTLINDAERMEDAAIDLMLYKDYRRYKLETIVYWLCVAVLHLCEWSVTRGKAD